MLLLSPRQVISATFDLNALVSMEDINSAAQLCDEELSNIVGGNIGQRETLRIVIGWFNKRGKIEEFLISLSSVNPALKDTVAEILLSAAHYLVPSHRFKIIGAGQTGISRELTLTNALEKQVRKVVQKLDMALFLSRAAAAESRICRIEYEDGRTEYGSPLGTGFLIGPDIVLTNWHVASAINNQVPSQAARCRFDYRGKDFDAINAGKTFLLAEQWKLADSPFAPGDIKKGAREAGPNELDYAVLHLSKPAGNDIFGTTSAARGWFDINKVAPPPPAEEPIFVLGHSDGQPSTISAGRVLAYAAGGRRLRHDAYTLPGASGSPVFNADFLPVALHHAGDPSDGPAQFNQAIPLGFISKDFEERRSPEGDRSKN